MKKYIIMTLVLLVALTGCNRDELLTIVPNGEVIPSTVAEFRLLLDERFSNNGNSRGRVPMHELDFFMSDDIQILDDANAASYVGGIGGDETRFFNSLTWQEIFCQPDEQDTDWNTMYNQIFVANVVIENMEDPAIIGDASERSQLLAEAQVHRAFAHFSLVNVYAKQYDPASASSDLGVVIKTTSAIEPLLRSSVQEVYDVVVQDLMDALDSGSLPELSDFRLRPSVSSTNAILAKVFLAMGNYAEALTYANNALNNYSELLDYNTIFGLPFYFNNPELFLFKVPPGLAPAFDIFVNDELLNMYAAADLRPGLRYPSSFTNFRPTFNRSPNTDFAFGFDGTSYIGPSVGEMFLIRAECNARIGDLTAVNDDLNTLLVTRFAFGTYLEQPDFTDRDSALAMVKDERRRELAGQGVRLFDIKRYNLLDNANISLTRTVEGVPITLEPNSNRFIAPIAPLLITLNSELEQSPR